MYADRALWDARWRPIGQTTSIQLARARSRWVSVGQGMPRNGPTPLLQHGLEGKGSGSRGGIDAGSGAGGARFA
jgi:hypothetical protein